MAPKTAPANSSFSPECAARKGVVRDGRLDDRHRIQPAVVLLLCPGRERRSKSVKCKRLRHPFLIASLVAQHAARAATRKHESIRRARLAKASKHGIRQRHGVRAFLFGPLD